MDISALAQAVTSLVLPVLPSLLKKVGESAAGEVGKKALGAVTDATKALWDRLWKKDDAANEAKATAQEDALKAAQKVLDKPDDTDRQAAFRSNLKDLLESDSALAKEIEELLAKATPAGSTHVSADRGGVATGGSVIGSTIITGGVKGDFIAGNKDKS